jgi:hypothetical protein
VALRRARRRRRHGAAAICGAAAPACAFGGAGAGGAAKSDALRRRERLPLTEKRESRSESARKRGLRDGLFGSPVCAWICTRMCSRRRSSASLASELMASSRISFSSRCSIGSTESMTL